MTEGQDRVEDFVARAQAAQQAVNDLGAGPPRPLSPDQQGLLAEASSPGTVVHGFLSWRADSHLLARMRPLLIDLLADANRAVCVEPNDRCLLKWPQDRQRWCEGCCLVDLAARLQSLT